MSNYDQRNNYFESIARNNKLLAHEQPITEGSSKLRKTYFRVNDLDELNAAVVGNVSSPVMVHAGHDIIFKQPGTGLPRKVIGNHLYFFSKTKPQNLANEIQAAYIESEEAMSQVLSYMNEQMEENMRCGNLFLFDLNNARAEQTEPFNNTWYGWHLTFYDETRACDLGYKNNDWFTPLEDGQDTGCNHDDDGDGGSSTSTAEIIYFNDQSSVTIEMTSERKAILGNTPLIQVWFAEDDEENTYNKVNVPVTIYGTPDNTTSIVVHNTGDASGFITLKRTV